MNILSDNLKSVNRSGGSLPLARSGQGLDSTASLHLGVNYGPPEVLNSPLGKDSEIVQPPPPVSFEIKDLSKWALQRGASIALSSPKWKRLQGCHRTLVSGSVTVNRHIETGKTHFGNLATCGSVWSCPVCAPKITEHRRNELKIALENAKDRRLAVSMLTLTVPHTKGDRLKDILCKVMHARRLMRNRKPWGNLMRKSGVAGSIRSLEVTYGDNGWHVHTHEILFSDYSSIPINVHEVLLQWKKACVTAGLDSPNGHGVDITLGDDGVGAYAVKWGIECEMTKSMIKKGSGGNSSPWDFLRDYALTGDEDKADLFREYSECFKGRHQLEWSKGLRAVLGLGDLKSDETIADEHVENSEVLYHISLEIWRVVLARELRHQVLFVAMSGADALSDYIESIVSDST